jgi:DJ-1 family protein
MTPSALIVLAPGAEEIEFVSAPDLLVRAGVDVVVAAAAEVPVVRGSRGVPLAAHCLLPHVAGRTFDLVYLPGGKGSAEACRTDRGIQELIARQIADGRWLAAICAAPTALIPGGHARGRTLTSFPGCRGDLAAAGATWRDAPVVIDGRLATSQAAGTSYALGLALAHILCGTEAARRIAAETYAPAAVLQAAGL